MAIFADSGGQRYFVQHFPSDGSDWCTMAATPNGLGVGLAFFELEEHAQAYCKMLLNFDEQMAGPFGFSVLRPVELNKQKPDCTITYNKALTILIADIPFAICNDLHICEKFVALLIMLLNSNKNALFLLGYVGDLL